MAITAAETPARHAASHEIWLNGRTQMRKIGLFAVAAALTLVSVGGWMEWVTSSSQARVATSAWDPVNPLQIMTNAKNLPHEEFVDYTTFFPARH
jgi:hypothetical protein